jgi:molybdopterin/thiamine biosynthesis adenylyltransferase
LPCHTSCGRAFFLAPMTSRYIRQETFAPIGKRGQKLLQDSSVLLVGCGGLGSVSADILVRAGIGTVRIADRDIVELSNLQRQVLFTLADVEARTPKAIAAAEHLRGINPDVTIDPRVVDVNAHSLPALLEAVDLIVDGTDNFETRYLLNDASVHAGIPWIYGGAVAGHGMSLPVIPGQTPCLTCLFEQMPPPGSSHSCDTAGVIAPILHTVASIQCTHAMKVLTRNWKPPATLTTVDIWEGVWRSIPLDTAPQESCITCQKREFPHLAAERGLQATSLCGREAVQLVPMPARPVDLSRVANKLASLGAVRQSPFLLTATIDAYTFTLFPDGRVVIDGTTDTSEARSLHARYLG